MLIAEIAMRSTTTFLCVAVLFVLIAAPFAHARLQDGDGSTASQQAASAPPTTKPQTQPASQPPTEKLIIAGEEFQLEIAATPEAREKGLMNRDKIEEHGGMIFIYPHPQVMNFWMKNCPIEMDILFVNTKGSIVAAHRMKPAPPRKPDQSEADYDAELPLYGSRRPAQFAIELKAGTIERLKIKPGDKIEMDAERLAGLTSEFREGD